MESKTPIYKIVAGVLAGAGLFLILKNTEKTKKVKTYNDSPETVRLNFDAKAVATEIHNIMRAVNWSNTEKNTIVLTALADLTRAEFGRVTKAFGLRGYNALTGNDYTPFGLFLTKRPLKFWLKSELSTSDFELLKQKFTNLL